ncbi:hypothetical protein NF713_03005 [Lactococcus formosensis]|nr:hypothetical protein [Lactococcus formosensis]MDG6189012.1 hypothetical protein [Lactococcus formosensis]
MENISSRLQEIWNSAPENFWLSLIILLIAILIFFLPVKIASSRGLSGGQIFGVFFGHSIWFLVSRFNFGTRLTPFSLNSFIV